MMPKSSVNLIPAVYSFAAATTRPHDLHRIYQSSERSNFSDSQQGHFVMHSNSFFILLCDLHPELFLIKNLVDRSLQCVGPPMALVSCNSQAGSLKSEYTYP